MRALAVAVAIVVAAPAWAGDLTPPATPPTPADRMRASELFENGQILYDEGRYDAAITAWEASYRLTGYPDLLFNISGAHERNGAFQAAYDTLTLYRVYAPAAERETIERRMRALEARLAAIQAGPAPWSGTPTSPPPATVVVPPPPPSQPRPKLPVGPITLGVVGLGGLGFGVFEATRAAGALGELGDACVTADAGLLCPGTARGAATTRGRAAAMAAGGIGAGGLAVAGAVVWWALVPVSGGVALRPEIGPDHVAVAGRW